MKKPRREAGEIGNSNRHDLPAVAVSLYTFKC